MCASGVGGGNIPNFPVLPAAVHVPQFGLHNTAPLVTFSAHVTTLPTLGINLNFVLVNAYIKLFEKTRLANQGSRTYLCTATLV